MEDLQGHVLTLKHRYEILKPLPRRGLLRRWRALLRPFDLEVELQVHDLFQQISAPAPVAEAIVRRMEQAARKAGALRSPGALRVLDYGELSPQTPFLVADAARGACLEDIIRHQGRLPLQGTVQVIEALASVLDEVHALGLGHLGLRAEHVTFEDLPSGTATRLGGFGLGLLRHELPLLGDDGEALDALDFDHLSPESVDGDAIRAWQARFSGDAAGAEEGWGEPGEALPPSPEPDDKVAADVFALAVLAYRCLVGESPFWTERPAALSARLELVRQCELIEPATHGVQLPDGVWRVLRGGMARDPGARPASAGDFARDLARAARVAPALAAQGRGRGRPGVPRGPGRRAGRRLGL